METNIRHVIHAGHACQCHPPAPSVRAVSILAWVKQKNMKNNANNEQQIMDKETTI